MLPPVTIPELDPATLIDYDNDQVLLRQGLNDRRATLDQINNFRLQNFPSLPSAIVESDVILVGRNDGVGGYNNFLADPRRLGFLTGVSMYFYCDTDQAPLYWVNRPELGNRVLAVKANASASGGASGGTNSAYTNWGLQGNWTLPPHTLTLSQIPAHRHALVNQQNKSGTLAANVIAGTQPSSHKNQAFTEQAGGGNAHNHGNTFRPLAAVGLICTKNG